MKRLPAGFYFIGGKWDRQFMRSPDCPRIIVPIGFVCGEMQEHIYLRTCHYLADDFRKKIPVYALEGLPEGTITEALADEVALRNAAGLN